NRKHPWIHRLRRGVFLVTVFVAFGQPNDIGTRRGPRRDRNGDTRPGPIQATRALGLPVTSRRGIGGCRRDKPFNQIPSSESEEVKLDLWIAARKVNAKSLSRLDAGRVGIESWNSR